VKELRLPRSSLHRLPSPTALRGAPPRAGRARPCSAHAGCALWSRAAPTTTIGREVSGSETGGLVRLLDPANVDKVCPPVPLQARLHAHLNRFRVGIASRIDSDPIYAARVLKTRPCWKESRAHTRFASSAVQGPRARLLLNWRVNERAGRREIE
jgi:hypothetical protein